MLTAVNKKAGKAHLALLLVLTAAALNAFGARTEDTSKPLGTQYAMPFLVQVSDGSGTPLEDATVKVRVRPLWYGKGMMELVDNTGLNLQQVIASGEDFSPDRWVMAQSSIVCPAEDLDDDRILDSLGASSEDVKNNGALDPQDPASLAADDGGFATLLGGPLSTDNNGSGFFLTVVSNQYSVWSYVEVTARTEALGDEATASFRTVLAMPGEEINNADQVPGNLVSPYGSDIRPNVVNQVMIDDLLMDVLGGCTSTY